MKVNEKQVSAFEDIFLNSVKKITQQDSIVTVTLADNTSYDFFTPEYPAITIEKGETGEAGDSAYDLYRQSGGSLSAEAWIDSFKGPTGERGWRGYQGEQGEQGTPGRDFNPIAGNIFLTDSDTATATLTGNVLSLTIPAVKSNGLREEPLHLGKVTTVSTGGKATASLKKTGDDAELLLSLPRGQQGIRGDNAVAAVDGKNPSVLVNISMDKEISVPSMEATTIGNTWDFKINVPEGKRGDIGTVTSNTVSDKDISYLEIVTMEGLINAPSFNSFMPIAVTLNGDLCYGWSFRNGAKDGFITQTVWNSKGKRLTRKKAKGYVFANITEGWQEGG